MQLSRSQQQTLADIGIQHWVLRPTTAKARPVETTEQPQAVETIRLDAELRLIVVTQDNVLSASARRLLGAMLKAVSLDPQQVRIVNIREFSQIALPSLSDKAVLLLGDEVSQQNRAALSADVAETVAQAGAGFAACYSLEHMLQQPAAKASAWQALKQLRKLF